MVSDNNEQEYLLNLDLYIDEECNDYKFGTSIDAAIKLAEEEKAQLVENLNETIDTIRKLTPDCDKLDYVLAASSGALCGIIDIFLVGAPQDSSLMEISDNWFEERVKDFAKMVGWPDGTKKTPIQFLECKYKIPYDLTGMHEAGLRVWDIDLNNHHFKSLAHNPSIVGLFFSILDQFGDSKRTTAHFIHDGELIIWTNPEGKFELKGKMVPAKLISGFVNWFCHLISDMSGSSSSKGRGAGIPSPLWTWANDIIAIKRSLNIETSQFDRTVNELALNIYTEGYDLRFQATQAIPVFVNELLVRMLYSVRRLMHYYTQINAHEYSLQSIWEACEPFSNATVKRMLTVAHGTFCLMDIGDATIRGFVKGGGKLNVKEFFLRLNLVGVGRFTISLYGEGDRSIRKAKLQDEAVLIQKEKIILDDYINGLHILSAKYNGQTLLAFIDDLQRSDAYISAFTESVRLAEEHNVPDDIILRTKSDIDAYFNRGNSNGKKRN
ncbi:MAG: hypothetical protein K6E41_09550 [Solobacterium sp.]|nr:hypothetical protein [Solobacterium sp.]